MAMRTKAQAANEASEAARMDRRTLDGLTTDVVRRFEAFRHFGTARPAFAGYNVQAAPADLPRKAMLSLMKDRGAILVAVTDRKHGTMGGAVGVDTDVARAVVRVFVLTRSAKAKATTTNGAHLSPSQMLDAAKEAAGFQGMLLWVPTDDHYLFTEEDVTCYRLDVLGTDPRLVPINQTYQ